MYALDIIGVYHWLSYRLSVIRRYPCVGAYSLPDCGIHTIAGDSRVLLLTHVDYAPMLGARWREVEVAYGATLASSSISTRMDTQVI